MTDRELVARVKAGDNSAYELLYQRYARAARMCATRFARDRHAADDLVAEAFARVLYVLRKGGGPEQAFRAYLMTTLRHLAGEWGATERRSLAVGDCEPYLRDGAAQPDPLVLSTERQLAARAFTELPARWQRVLWDTEVEGEAAADIASRLGLSPGAVAALALRAREGLRLAYLRAHLGEAGAPEGCRAHVDRLAALARGRLARRHRDALERHLVDCDRCRALFDELVETNRRLCALVAPPSSAPAHAVPSPA